MNEENLAMKIGKVLFKDFCSCKNLLNIEACHALEESFVEYARYEIIPLFQENAD